MGLCVLGRLGLFGVWYAITALVVDDSGTAPTDAAMHRGRWHATASSDHSARLWDLSQGDSIRHYTGHHKAVTCVALQDT